MLICLHGYSVVVIVISSCFGMKLQSKYASVRLVEHLSVVYKCEESSLQNMSNSVFWFFPFLIAVWKLVSDIRMYLGCFWCVGISLFMPSSCLNKSTELLTGWTAAVSQTKHLKQLQDLFLLFVVNLLIFIYLFFFVCCCSWKERNTTKSSTAYFSLQTESTENSR